MTTREKFVARFSEADAAKIEHAAVSHRVEDNSYRDVLKVVVGEQAHFAPDQFLLDLSTCISYECVTKYRECHEIEAGEAELREWIAANVPIPAEYRDPQCSAYDDYLATNGARP